MTMIPNQVMDAIHFAEFVIKSEKKDRIGSSQAYCPHDHDSTADQPEGVGRLRAAAKPDPSACSVITKLTNRKRH